MEETASLLKKISLERLLLQWTRKDKQNMVCNIVIALLTWENQFWIKLQYLLSYKSYGKLFHSNRHVSLYCTLLYQASQILCFFYRLKVCGHPALSEVDRIIFSSKVLKKNKAIYILKRHSSVGKEYACDVGDLGLIGGLGRSPGGGNGNPLQYSCLENPMDRGTWRATVRGVTRVGHDLVTKPPMLLHTIDYSIA